MNFKNIKIRLLFWYSITIFILLISFYFIFMYVFYQKELDIIDTKILSVKNYIEHNIKDKYKDNFKDNFDDEEEDFALNHLLIRVYEKHSNKYTLITQSGKVSLELKNKQDYKLNQLYTIGEDDNQIRIIWYRLDELKNKNLFVEISTTIDDKINKNIEALEDTLVYLIPLILLIAILIAYFIIKNAFNSVKNIINEVKNIELDDLNTRLTIHNSNDEIDELIITFNSMLDKIEESVTKIKRFSNDVSHELKTPLTVIVGELEYGLRQSRDTNEYKSILKTSLEETKILQNLIDNLFLLSSINKKEIQNKFEKVDIDEVLIDVISLHKIAIKEKDINIEFLQLENIQINANIQLIKVMLSNIIQNSIKYSNDNSSIEISLKDNICTIKDYGIGIKEEYLEKIKDRFYRIDESRSRGGYGLGLSIVTDIVKLHNIEMKIQSKYNEFTEVIFVFK